ncbi:MAG: hypothetical protein GXO54_02965 [Chloroflexi bacterium]|nr:hypothetical protein [Chloroflexota bacterium]
MSRTSSPPRPRRGRRLLRGLLVLAWLLVLAVAWRYRALWLPRLRATALAPTPIPIPTMLPTPSPTASPTPSPSPSSLAPRAAHPTAAQPDWALEGLFIFALREGPHIQLYAYHPQGLHWARLTADPYDHTDPVLAIDGRALFFSANPDGNWDIYLLDLATGTVQRVTHEATYQAAASPSPDRLWMVYEMETQDGGIDLFVRQIQRPDETPARLTHDPAPDYAAAWSPQGRLIAFTSTRSGTPQIWVADLDRPAAERFHQVSLDEEGPATQAAWSPDGRYLAWGQTRAGLSQIWIWDASAPTLPARALGEGTWARWLPSGQALAVVVRRPEADYFTVYHLDGRLLVPAQPIPGRVSGFVAGVTALPWPLPEAYAAAAQQTPTPLWTPATVQPTEPVPAGRAITVPVPGSQAPYPYLSDLVDEAFAALRQAVQQAAGWDALAEAVLYWPITRPQEIPLETSWLSTGRAFALPDRWRQEGKLVVYREDYGAQTYWRVYLRVADAYPGGRPLRGAVWDFDARARATDPMIYAQGGAYNPYPPKGYWIDFTDLAEAYGWERLPALPYWTAYLPASRYNQFVLRQGRTWEQAMQELHAPGVWQPGSP